MKNKYVTPETEVLYFETQDVIMTSTQFSADVSGSTGDTGNGMRMIFDPTE